jgi:branched-chain amino acid transport system substrate-binding protein
MTATQTFAQDSASTQLKGFATSTAPIGTNNIVLGQSVPLSGSNADIDRDMRDGAMAVFAPFTGSPSARNYPNVFTVHGSYMDEAGKSNVQLVANAFDAASKPRVFAVKRNVKLETPAFDSVLKEPPHYLIFTTQFTVVGDYMKAAQAKGISTPVTALSFVNPDELARTYGTVARGAIVSQVAPSPGGALLYKNPVLRDCAKLLKEYSGAQLDYTSLEACIAAKAMVRVIQKVGPTKITRQSLLKGFENAGRIDLDGFVLDYTNSHHGSKFADITFLSRDSMFQAK